MLKMTFGISMLDNIFPMHTETQNHHLKVSHCVALNVIIYIIFHIKKTTYVESNIILALADLTLQDFQASSLGLLQTMYVTLNIMNNVVEDCILMIHKSIATQWS